MITINNQQSIPVDTTTLKKNAQKILNFLGYKNFDLGIVLATKEYIHLLNKKYRDKDKPTDILSFPYYPNAQPGKKIIASKKEDQNLGDIIICPKYVQEDLARWNQNFDDRMQTLLVHGVCHLLGYDLIGDKDYKIMHQKETILLEMLKK
jgi:probable rRNA maturation factor